MTTVLPPALASQVTPLAFPSPVFADTQVRPGQVTVLMGVDAEGHRHVYVIAALRPHPWTAFARARRVTNGQPYSVWLASTRACLLAALGTQQMPVYPNDATLGLAMSFGARKCKIGAERRATSILDFDYTNCFKAWEDVMSKNLIYHDDAQVRFHGPGAAVDSRDDFVSAHVWEGGPWDESWGEYTIPTVEEANA